MRRRPERLGPSRSRARPKKGRETGLLALARRGGSFAAKRPALLQDRLDSPARFFRQALAQQSCATSNSRLQCRGSHGGARCLNGKVARAVSQTGLAADWHRCQQRSRRRLGGIGTGISGPRGWTPTGISPVHRWSAAIPRRRFGNQWGTSHARVCWLLAVGAELAARNAP